MKHAPPFAGVSIRAPALRPGRHNTTCSRLVEAVFQSAPRPCDRGDEAPAFGVRFRWCFNPRPGLATGATARPCATRSAARCFNPRPGLATGATGTRSHRVPTATCFNPRPGLATGATKRPVRPRKQLTGFNPRPGLATGATLDCRERYHVGRVSIRAPALRPGRLWREDNVAALVQFQSAPRPCDRGDVRGVRNRGTTAWFQSAPRPCDRGDGRVRSGLSRRACFNPRPGLATGATPLNQGRNRARCVSIRAPALRPGRRHRRGDGVAQFSSEFQSAPRPCDRGDGRGAGVIQSSGRFNPRPGLATGATGVRLRDRAADAVSIRAPALRPGRRKRKLLDFSPGKFQSAPRPCDRGDFFPG